MKTYLLATALVGTMLLGVGCSQEMTQRQRLYHDLAYSLETQTATRGQVHNQMRRTAIHNMRGINEDILRLGLLDRPSRSTVNPMQ